ncbi:MAG: hypothetical protein E6J41_14770 [Chloroflexi bacterium]|nr:MAG: hypothetical protein E6J41_14770 [Chloroflexota bacterium]
MTGVAAATEADGRAGAPPATEAASTTCRPAAELWLPEPARAETPTFSVRGGNDRPGASTAGRPPAPPLSVHTSVGSFDVSHVQPEPAIETRLRSWSTTSVRVTGVVPSVGAVPVFVTVSVYVSLASPWTKLAGDGLTATFQATCGPAGAATAAGPGPAPAAAGSGVPATTGVPSKPPKCSTPASAAAARWAVTAAASSPAGTVAAGTFQPLTLTTGWRPPSSAVSYRAVRVCDWPGHSVTSLSLQVIGTTWLSPAWSRRTSARRKNATAGAGAGFVSVTRVTVWPPSVSLLATARTPVRARPWSARRSPNWGRPDVVALVSACGLPCVSVQSTTSFCVESQYTLRSTTAPRWRTTSSTQYAWAGAGGAVVAGTRGVSTAPWTSWLGRLIPLATWSSSTAPAKSWTRASTETSG